MKVLVTNSECPIALAIMRSLGKKGVDVIGCSSFTDNMGFHSKFISESIVLPNPDRDCEDYVNRISEIAAEKDISIVIPGDQWSLFPLSENRKKLGGATLALPSHDVLVNSNDKKKSAKSAINAGVSVPDAMHELKGYSARDIVGRLGVPVFIKHKNQAGGIGMSTASSIAELQEVLDGLENSIDDYLVQEAVSGRKFSFSGLFDNESEAKRLCVHRTLREYPVSGGCTSSAVTVKEPKILESGLKASKALNWSGVNEIEFMLDEKDGIPKMLDFNPRFFGSVALPIAASVDYPLLYSQMLLGEEIGISYEYAVGVAGRSMLHWDLRHLRSVLSGSRPVLGGGRIKTFADFMAFWRYDVDFIWSRSDPGPGLYQLRQICARKTSLPGGA